MTAGRGGGYQEKLDNDYLYIEYCKRLTSQNKKTDEWMFLALHVYQTQREGLVFR